MKAWINKDKFITDLPRLGDCKFIVPDTETTGLHWWSDMTYGLSLTLPDRTHFYLDLRDESNLRYAQGELPKVPHWINHNIKFDLHALANRGVKPRPETRTSCTMVRAALINEHEHSYSLDAQSRMHLDGRGKLEIDIKRASEFEPNQVAEYALQDTDLALDLFLYQEPQIAAQEGLEQVISLEEELTQVLFDIERVGVRVDIEATQKAIIRITNDAKKMKRELDKLTGKDFNINSPKQVMEFFNPTRDGKLWRIGREIIPSTKGGGPSFNAETLLGLAHPAAKMINGLRRIIKLRDTFLMGHILGHHHNGVVHTTFNQTRTDQDAGTITGRLSSTDPALQQIHKRDKELAAITRPLFIPFKGQEWVCMDLAQIDFRWFAHYVQEPALDEAYAKDPNTDFHGIVAALTGLPRDRQPNAGGGNAKQLNLGMTFGMGMGRMAKEMGLPYEEREERGKIQLFAGSEARHVFDLYHQTIPGVKRFLRDAERIALKRGYVRSPLGRRLRYPHGMGAHKAGGHIFQAATADTIKQKMIEIHRELKRGDHLLLSVHDELDLSMKENPKEVKRLKGIFEDLGPATKLNCRIPIRSSVGVGGNWWQASK